MQVDPISEWQRLTEHYRQITDEELRELAVDFSDLTEAAQQVLRSEMRSRGLGDPENAGAASPVSQPAAMEPAQAALPLRNAPWAGDPVDVAFGTPFGARAPELVPDTPDTDDKVAGPHEFTWKTPLCECETPAKAWQISETLKQAGIESWIESPRAYAVDQAGLLGEPGGPRVLVAADQLDEARLVAARPIPREIVEASETSESEFTPPKCPACGATDPVLEGVEPENTWRCEQCGKEWTEALAGPSPGLPT
jgi:hypothetical protein